MCGCQPGGPRIVNLGYNVRSRDDVTGDGSSLAWLDTHDFWLPTLLFGWQDTNADGSVEILSTHPYGATP